MKFTPCLQGDFLSILERTGRMRPCLFLETGILLALIKTDGNLHLLIESLKSYKCNTKQLVSYCHRTSTFYFFKQWRPDNTPKLFMPVIPFSFEPYVKVFLIFKIKKHRNYTVC